MRRGQRVTARRKCGNQTHRADAPGETRYESAANALCTSLFVARREQLKTHYVLLHFNACSAGPRQKRGFRADVAVAQSLTNDPLDR